MQAKPRDRQGELYSVELDFLCNESLPLFRLPQVIDWSEFDQAFGQLYSEGQGRPAKPARLMVGLHHLKHAFDLSDEEVVRNGWRTLTGNTSAGGHNYEGPAKAHLARRGPRKVKTVTTAMVEEKVGY